MTEQQKASLWLVEVVWQGETLRSWWNGRVEATARLIALASELPKVNTETEDEAHEALIDDDRCAWADLSEVDESPLCPKCDAIGGWHEGYCEPCGYQFGEDLDI
ncbi:hypothetical protein UFOVP1131_23 [uncultured Caudovirales phage]|uniref:Uncharacterized protein n=1 Tax=uncultured Caudovirales phage TaxID=2100421 RepID=A0A6J5PT30_9CAUD|nr:hypothetical protein UFOVP966_37 [uncultured Caudovirales phage]CAB4184671.1 hypothetical protein UFOVP1131_23 [uncultured Caudovirales phage]CAB4192593.1 hypothetical protein UFOVP1245_39 [uncultured Caudovirales phage]CAB5231010.1 hypothetical protein UFOVP1582_15 [uncultured Caudovirales phage]